MPRTLTALAVLTLFAAPALAKDLETSIKFKKKNDKVVLTVKVPPSEWRKGKVRVNFYAGKTADATKRMKKFKGKMKRPSQTWSFSRKKLCGKGHKHLRVKIKVKGKDKFDDMKKTYDIDC